jgi:hypothetical protein
MVESIFGFVLMSAITGVHAVQLHAATNPSEFFEMAVLIRQKRGTASQRIGQAKAEPLGAA